MGGEGIPGTSWRASEGHEALTGEGEEEPDGIFVGDTEKKLDEAGAKLFVSVGALLNYIAPDRPEMQFGIKEVMRRCSCPTESDLKRLKRIARFIIGHPRRAIKFEFQSRPDYIDMFVDSDYAGCPRTRKSTAGGCAMFGTHCLKTWAKTLPILALSSGEAELMAVVKGTTEAFGLQALLLDLGIK